MSKQRSSALDPDLAQRLDEHVSFEAHSALTYFSMASWAEVRGFTGFSAWFRSEATGEIAHMTQFIDHLNNRGFQATIRTLEAPRSEWSSITELFEAVVELEHRLGGQIADLIELSHKCSDHFAGSFLQGFVPQQITDTAEADEILDRLRIVGDDGRGLILIDQELRAKAG